MYKQYLVLIKYKSLHLGEAPVTYNVSEEAVLRTEININSITLEHVINNCKKVR